VVSAASLRFEVEGQGDVKFNMHAARAALTTRRTYQT
jgi:hypothetical protein